MDSGKTCGASAGIHVAIIMDGNGRWAAAKGRPRTVGHRAGARAVRRTVEAAVSLGLGGLTLYAFSSDNWKRPRGEVATLMRLLTAYLLEQAPRCVEHGIRVSVIGRRDRLPAEALDAIQRAESATARCDGLRLRLAVDYSSRDTIVRAAAKTAWVETGHDGPAERADFARRLGEACGEAETAPDVDLLIRTGGEQRLSDFLLWECAYAELYFTSVMWPDFGKADLESALEAFARRERRFGGLRAAAAV